MRKDTSSTMYDYSLLLTFIKIQDLKVSTQHFPNIESMLLNILLVYSPSFVGHMLFYRNIEIMFLASSYELIIFP